MNAPRVLLVSNGAGEDAIAREVACRAKGLDLDALPLVGQGVAYEGVARRVGPRRSMPSGGLIPEALGNLLRDLAGGLAGQFLGLDVVAVFRAEGEDKGLHTHAQGAVALGRADGQSQGLVRVRRLGIKIGYGGQQPQGHGYE